MHGPAHTREGRWPTRRARSSLRRLTQMEYSASFTRLCHLDARSRRMRTGNAPHGSAGLLLPAAVPEGRDRSDLPVPAQELIDIGLIGVGTEPLEQRGEHAVVVVLHDVGDADRTRSSSGCHRPSSADALQGRITSDRNSRTPEASTPSASARSARRNRDGQGAVRLLATRAALACPLM
jgi:hypothetical protein